MTDVTQAFELREKTKEAERNVVRVAIHLAAVAKQGAVTGDASFDRVVDELRQAAHRVAERAYDEIIDAAGIKRP